MGAYVLRRLLLIVPTLFGILLVNFALVQFMPGGPIEQIIAELDDQSSGATDRISGGGAETGGSSGGGEYRGAQGLPPEFIEGIEIYKDAHSIPPPHGAAWSDCGAILIWTRYSR